MRLYELLYVISDGETLFVSDGIENYCYDGKNSIPQELNLSEVENITTDAQGNINISIIE